MHFKCIGVVHQLASVKGGFAAQSPTKLWATTSRRPGYTEWVGVYYQYQLGFLPSKGVFVGVVWNVTSLPFRPFCLKSLLTICTFYSSNKVQQQQRQLRQSSQLIDQTDSPTRLCDVSIRQMHLDRWQSTEQRNSRGAPRCVIVIIMQSPPSNREKTHVAPFKQSQPAGGWDESGAK